MYQSSIHIDEHVLLRNVQAGEESAFEQVYHLYKRPLAFSLRRLLKSNELVEEVLQEAFVKLWNNRRQLDDRQGIRPYLYKIAENLVYDLYRKAARDKKMRAMLGATATDAYCHVEENLLEGERTELLEQAISLLPPQRQKIFRMSKLEGMSYEEISNALNISKSTINDHLLKASRFLRSYMSQHHFLLYPFLIWSQIG